MVTVGLEIILGKNREQNLNLCYPLFDSYILDIKKHASYLQPAINGGCFNDNESKCLRRRIEIRQFFSPQKNRFLTVVLKHVIEKCSKSLF